MKTKEEGRMELLLTDERSVSRWKVENKIKNDSIDVHRDEDERIEGDENDKAFKIFAQENFNYESRERPIARRSCIINGANNVCSLFAYLLRDAQ